MKLVLISALLALGIGLPAAAQTAKVDSGQVRGSVEDKITVFRGIPFAAAPVGDLRWAPPKPVAHWDGVKETTKNSVSCLQKMSGDGRPNGGGAFGPMAEDCLYLNVFAPAGAKKRPVMVWLHGGANTLGSGIIYDMKPFARDGVLVVSINYRLGAFGFFAHPALTKAADGSAGGPRLGEAQYRGLWRQSR
jgi:para-nitrobenzyl esterase